MKRFAPDRCSNFVFFPYQQPLPKINYNALLATNHNLHCLNSATANGLWQTKSEHLSVDWQCWDNGRSNFLPVFLFVRSHFLKKWYSFTFRYRSRPFNPAKKSRGSAVSSPEGSGRILGWKRIFLLKNASFGSDFACLLLCDTSHNAGTKRRNDYGTYIYWDICRSSYADRV